ncbi:MAG: protein kinase [Deltaproteobacteria bacterium]|nr:protein kinase [Deltaproteobacteria bacterium]
MATREHFLARLLELPRIQDPDVRRGVFRQTIAALGQTESSGGPMALAGVDPKALGRSVQTVAADGLLDDLDFIAPAAAAVGLYQIASALPLGSERRIIGRKVLLYLYKGNAETFATLASRMALGSTRPLEGAGIRARIALAMWLRSHADSAVDRLALAIITRRELAAQWVNTGATGSLPDRRLAGRLIERAAREAARRATAGDEHPLGLFSAVVDPQHWVEPPRPDGFISIGPAWRSLLADRETLVWRQVAVARGLLCAVIPAFVDETKAMLQPDLSPTEWRRGATSLVARIAVDRESGLRDALAVLEGPLLRRDPGIAQALIWGLTPVAEVEPEAAEKLVEAIASISPISIADSLVELRSDVEGFGAQAAELCAEALRNSLVRPELDDGLSALARAILEDLETGGENRQLFRAVHAGLEAFGEGGTRDAFDLARQALAVASEQVGQLERLDVGYGADVGDSEARRAAMKALRDIDTCLLESRVLNDLLLLGRPPGSTETGVDAIDDLDSRLARWLLDAKRRSASDDEVKAQATLHQRQLRALLHLIDAGNTDFGDDHERRMRVRARWILAARVWGARVHEQPKSRLTRAIIATVARAFDALVRDGAAEPLDIFLYAATYFTDPAHIGIIAEASMHPDVEQLLGHYLAFMQTECAGTSAEKARTRIEAFAKFLDAFPGEATMRSEAFRITAWSLVHALEAVMAAGSLRALVPEQGAAGSGTPLAALEDAIGQLEQLVIGAQRRCSDEISAPKAALPPPRALAHAVENAVNTQSQSDLLETLTATARAADATLPSPIAKAITQTLPRLTTLQLDRPSIPPSTMATHAHSLPDWLPPRRIVGGFYVLKQLSAGNVGSVFVVNRAEERHDETAAQFALKVPEYNATAARTMSEAEFLKLFREEAGALLAIPEHPNIANFVTFDAGAKPKPILVMELIEGIDCERVIYSQSFDTALALQVVDGVAAGLEAMHERGIAHLDVKPSNAIMRRKSGDPVLVDFGLAGRHLRPGCATLLYGAPEIWEAPPGQPPPGSPTMADVYALGCFAFEVMTGHTLFEGTTDVAIISAHISHDGLPPGVDRMAQNPALQPFAMFLYQCLRHDAAARPPMTSLRKEWRKVAEQLASRPWPLRIA